MKRTREMAAECAQFPDDMPAGERVWRTDHLRQRIVSLQWKTSPKTWNAHALARNGKLFALREWRDEIPGFDELNQKGCTPMSLAAWHGHLEVVKWLDAEKLDTQQTIALNFAVCGHHIKIVEYLIADDSLLSYVSRALYLALGDRYMDTIEILAKKVPIQDYTSYLAHSVACENYPGFVFFYTKLGGDTSPERMAHHLEEFCSERSLNWLEEIIKYLSTCTPLTG